MPASDHLGPQFRARTRKNPNGTSDTTINAYEGGRNTGYAKVTNDGGTFLDSVEVRPESRGRGLGHALVGEVVKRYGNSPIKLLASPYGEGDRPNTPQLKNFYGKHGFESVSEDSDYMIRRPQ